MAVGSAQPLVNVDLDTGEHVAADDAAAGHVGQLVLEHGLQVGTHHRLDVTGLLYHLAVDGDHGVVAHHSSGEQFTDAGQRHDVEGPHHFALVDGDGVGSLHTGIDISAMNCRKVRLNYLFLQVFMPHLYKSLIVFSRFFCDFGKCN